MNFSGPLIKTCQHSASGSNRFPAQEQAFAAVYLKNPIIISKIFVPEEVGNIFVMINITRTCKIELIYDTKSTCFFSICCFLRLEENKRLVTFFMTSQLSTFMK